MNIIDDFKSLRRKVERMDQKAEFEEKNPPAPMWFNMPITWTPEGGYGKTLKALDGRPSDLV